MGEKKKIAAIVLLTAMVSACVTAAAVAGRFADDGDDMRGTYDVGHGKTMSLLAGDEGADERSPLFIYDPSDDENDSFDDADNGSFSGNEDSLNEDGDTSGNDGGASAENSNSSGEKGASSDADGKSFDDDGEPYDADGKSFDDDGKDSASGREEGNILTYLGIQDGETGTAIFKGSSSPVGTSCRIIYDAGGKTCGVLVRSGEEYLFIKSSERPIRVEKIDSEPTIPGN